jgi:aminopeptidase N
VDAAYPPGIKYWDEVALFARLSVEYLSHEWPAIPFPYPKVTSFNGERTRAGGMETPMMCNNGSYSSRGGQIGVTIHEIAHNYMPFFMGTNERKYAWMDEGWASFFTLDLVKRLEPGEDEMPGVVSALSSSLGNETMLPLMTPSYAALTQGYGLMAYQQPALAYLILKDFLGDELFKKALQDYMNNWNGKHPLPYDFFFTFNRVAGEDLAWFWKPWFFERGYADLAVEEVKEFRGKKFNIHISNYGSYPVPIDLEVTYADGSKEKFYKPASVWKNGANRFEFVIETGKEFKKVELISRLSPDSNPRNNSYSLK